MFTMTTTLKNGRQFTSSAETAYEAYFGIAEEFARVYGLDLEEAQAELVSLELDGSLSEVLTEDGIVVDIKDHLG